LQNNIYFPPETCFSMAHQSLVSGPPHYQGFTFTLRQTTLGKTPLNK